MGNGHITRYLDQYMAMSQTDFAVFIIGEWGCGKTFFIDEYIGELRKKSTKVCRVAAVFISGMMNLIVPFAVRKVARNTICPPERVERRVPDYSHGRTEFSRRHQRDQFTGRKSV